MATRSVSNAVLATSVPNQGSGVKSVTTNGTVIAIAAYQRVALWLSNTGNVAVSVGLGAPAVAGQGIVLPVGGDPICIQNFTGPIYFVVATSSGSVAYAEY
jgi:hypothetical protein